MKSKLKFSVLLLATLLFSQPIFADQNDQLLQWFKQTLTTTLSVNYTQSSSDYDEVKKNYTLNAWQGLSQFLGGYMDVVRAQQLTLHPILEGEPTIAMSGTITSGVFTGIQYWRINQNVLIPELNTELYFSVVVILRTSNDQPPFIIQSMSITKNPI